MSSVSRKRGLDDDCTVDNDAKMRRDDGQVLHETEPFHSIDDVIAELRSIEGFVAPLKVGTVRQILERLTKSDTLVPHKQGRDVASETDQQIVHMDAIEEMRRLVDDYVPSNGRALFEEQLGKFGSNPRLISRQTNDRQDLNGESETLDSAKRREPCQQELHSLQTGKLSISKITEEDQVIVELKPDIENLRAGGDGFTASSAVSTLMPDCHKQLAKVGSYSQVDNRQTTRQDVNSVLDTISSSERNGPSQQQLHTSEVSEQSTNTFDEGEVLDSKLDVQNLPAGGDGFVSSSDHSSTVEFSNQLKNIAQVNFNEQLLKKLRRCFIDERNTISFEQVCDMIVQRTALIDNAQYLYNLADHQQFNQEILSKLAMFKQHDMVFQELLGMLLSDFCSSSWPYFKYLSDLDLLKCIGNNSDSAAAEDVLRSRKLKLLSLCFGSSGGSMQLTLKDSELGDKSAGITDCAYRRFEYRQEVNKVDADHMFKLLKIVLKFYDIHDASITLLSNGWKREANYTLMKSIFGAPKAESKLEVKQISVESPEMIDFIRWFWNVKVIISCDPGVLDSPSLFAGVKIVECKGINADRLMENCNTEVLLIGKATWGDESIKHVLTTHRLSGRRGLPRKIAYRCVLAGHGNDTVKEFRKLFDEWSRDFKAKHGNHGRRVTMSDNNIDHVILNLH